MEDLKKQTDEQVAEYVRAQDQEAYLELVLRYQEKLLRYAKALSRDEAKAADIVQNTLIKAFVNLNSFDVTKKFSTWIFRIAHNEAIDEIKRKKHELPMLEDLDFDSPEDLEGIIFQKEEIKMVHDCLTEMPLMYSEPLELLFLEEKSYEEISDILRLPIGTVGTRISRAKKIMRKLCQKINK